MGLGFKGDTGHFHSFSENSESLKSSFKFNEKTGYFGNKGQSGKGRNSKVREIQSDDPIKTAKDFYDKAANGGTEQKLSNGEGFITVMKDGTVLTYRETSHSDGSPAVDINISSSKDCDGVKTQKIHFTKLIGG